MPTIQLTKIFKELGTNSVREMFDYTGLPETSVSKQAQAADMKLFYLRNQGFRGPFGFPIGDYAFTDQGGTRPFAGGLITTQSGTPQGERMTCVRVRYLGFHCHEESSEWSSSDEPYFILGVAGANRSNTVRVGPYEEPGVDAGDDRVDIVEVASIGTEITPPIVLGVVAMEHDSGSPEEAETKVRTVFEDIEKKFDQIAGGTALTGADTGNHVLPEWSREILIGWIPEGIAALFGLADDEVGKNSVILFDNKAELQEWRAPAVQQSGPFQYNVSLEVGEHDEGGKYTVYFLVDLFDITWEVRPRLV
ncbi:MAG: hypothetical protein MUF49_13380 [Oculatellaceae cyanobacterium Prado106]|jgi:hypothetical protein|nr:hypothetical protein [Oculatellaceae cyanobacterium Prado106]